MSYYGVSSTTRIVGLASGLDVDAIVKSLIQNEQAKIDSIWQKKAVAELKQNALKEVNSLIFEFTTKYLSASSPLTNINMSSAFNAKKVIGGGSGEFAVITADSAAVEGEYTINEIISLAKEASIASSGAVSASADNKINLSTQLKDLALGTQLQFSSGFISFNINGNDFTFSESDTLNTVISTVNRSDAGVTMSYSSLSDGLTVKSKAKGADSAFVISDVSESNFFAAFNISGGTVNNGTNAVLRINNYMVEQNSNVFTIDGITYNLLKSTSNETSFVVTQDVDSIYNSALVLTFFSLIYTTAEILIACIVYLLTLAASNTVNCIFMFIDNTSDFHFNHHFHLCNLLFAYTKSTRMLYVSFLPVIRSVKKNSAALHSVIYVKPFYFFICFFNMISGIFDYFF
jgi:flagellar capping protein FliD